MPFLTDLYNVSNLEQHHVYLLKHGISLVEADYMKLGSEEGYTRISKTDGSLRLKGTSSVWKDMIADLFGRRLHSTAGKLDYDYNENALKFQSGGNINTINDRVGGNLEINHEYKIGTSITFKPHFHWFQSNANENVMTLRYRLQRNGQAKNTTWTTITSTVNSTNNAYTYSSGTINQITKFPDITLTCDVSDTIQFQLARTDSNGGDMYIYFLDVHGEIDSMGSEEEFAKDD